MTGVENEGREDPAGTELYANVARELASPLTLLLATIEDELSEQDEQPLPPERYARLQVAHRSGLRLLKVARTLVDFASVQNGRVHASFEPWDLASLTSDVATSFRPAIDNAGLRLSLGLSKLSEPVYVDREAWEKVVLSLLSNALKHTFKGGITLGLHDVGDAGDAVELWVEDTGTGIPPASVPRVFDLFHRVKGVRARSSDSTGISLALVREMVRLHGGDIRVESRLGSGSSFRVRLPRGSAHLPASRIVAPAKARSNLGEPRLRRSELGALGASVQEEVTMAAPVAGSANAPLTPSPLVHADSLGETPEPPLEAASTRNPRPRILWADDNADMRAYVARLLREEYEVEAVADGEAALESARARPPDLVLSDVMMPRLDGFELLEALRADERTRLTPVILLAARAGEEARRAGRQADADDYLVKPFSAKELLTRVRACLALARLRKESSDELERANRALAQAAAAKASFLASMSHEIRTPMNAVIGMTGLLLETKLEGTQLEFVETIRASGEHLLTIINDILDFSKIEAGRMELERAPFDLAACVEDAMDLVANDANRKGLELVYDSRLERATWVTGDVSRLRQVIVNLLSNAVKFTERGEVVVTLTEAGSDPRRVEITVRDTGIGMIEEQRTRLFDAFTQADASTTRKYGGTGLGLAISKRLVESMGGTIRVESESGVGSAFRFTLAAPPAAGEALRTADGLRGMHALIVDDNRTNLRILSQQLARWGIEVWHTDSPRAALAKVAEGAAFDLALLDFNMPEMDGLALAREIRASERPRDLASGGRAAGAAARGMQIAILSSGGLSAEAKTEDLVQAILRKPIKQSHLYDLLAGLFSCVVAPQPPPSTQRFARPAPEARVEPAAAQSPLPVPAASSAPALRILLAEDHPVNARLARLLLEKLGHRTDLVANGLEAFQAAEQAGYDLILMDCEMPEMDGFEATRKIRETLPADKQPYIVAMTANALEGDRERCLAGGMDDYVAKPVRPAVLAAAVARAAAARDKSRG